MGCDKRGIQQQLYFSLTNAQSEIRYSMTKYHAGIRLRQKAPALKTLHAFDPGNPL
jgi:hypothetical protein